MGLNDVDKITEAYEKEKKKYQNVLADIGVNMNNFVPFVMCASGFMGPSAMSWFKKICDVEGYRNAMLSWYRLACFRLATAVGIFEDSSMPALRSIAI